MVGDKKFSYTGEGKRKAKQYATETSKLMHVGYRKGGGALRAWSEEESYSEKEFEEINIVKDISETEMV